MARSLAQAITDELSAYQLFPFFALDFTDGTNDYKYTTLDVPVNLDILNTELITNGDMELDSGWNDYETPSTNERSAEQAHGGTYSRKFVIDSQYDGIACNTNVSTTDGKVYQATCWVYGDGTNALMLRFRIGGGGGFFYHPVAGDGDGWIPTASWQEMTWYFTADGTSSAGYIQFIGDTGITAGTFYIDDVSLREVGEFSPRGFEFESINYTLSNVMDDCTLRIDNLDSVLTSIFVDGTVEENTASVYLGLLDTDGSVVGTVLMFTGEVDSFELDETEVRMVIGSIFTRWSQQAYNKHSASCRWKVFKGTECGYAGAETWCDRSYTRCVVLANTADFGGFRFLPSIENKKVWWGPSPSEYRSENG